MSPYSHLRAPTALCLEPYSIHDPTPSHHHHKLSFSPSYHSTSTTKQSTQKSHTTTPNSLPELNFSSLPSLCALPTELCTARRTVEKQCDALTELTPYLYIGGAAAARNGQALDAANITHVINLSAGRVPNYYEADNNMYQFRYLQLYIRDDSSQCLDLVFQPVLDYVREARREGGACFIHCCEGISRSSAAAAAFFIMDKGYSYEKALQEIREKRPVAAPNEGFVKALTRLETKVRNGLKRPRVWRVNNEATGGKRNVIVEVEQRRKKNLDEVFLMERMKWQGVVVYGGLDVDKRCWNDSLDIAANMVAQMDLERKWANVEGKARLEVVRNDKCEELDSIIAGELRRS